MKALAKKTPLIRLAHRLIKEPLYRYRFSGDCYGCFFGVFETFEEAIAAAPKTKPVGYDNPELAEEYLQMLQARSWEGRNSLIHTYDYPILFWLNTLLNIQKVPPSVFDFGGNIGIHLYAYSQYIELPSSLRWMVCDLPSIVSVGESFLAEHHQEFSGRLLFTSDVNQLDDYKILLASGSLQYVEDFAATLQSLPSKPNHLLINRLPLYEGKQFVSLQNGGKVFYPQYVFNKTAFLNSLKDLNYELIDNWEDYQTACMIPFHSENSVPYYHGFYFRRK